MIRIRTFFKKVPFHLILLPLFFIAETWTRYHGLLDRSETTIAFFIIQSIVLVAFLIVSLLLGNKLKAGIIITVFSSLYLYFGVIKISLSNISFLYVFSHYKVLIPILLTLSLFFIFKILKNKNVFPLNLYLNILFATFLLLELIKIPFIKDGNVKLETVNIKPVTETPSLMAQPNIYYLLFDCYPSTLYQQQVLGIKNNCLDSLLTSKKFYVVKNSKSNYSNTAFSMAATFGMNYISGVDTSAQMSPVLYNKAMNMVKRAPIFSLLKKAGYNFINYSIFDFADQPALKKEKFLSITTTQLIFYSSFYHCIRRDLFWQLFPALHKKSIKKEKDYLKKLFRPDKIYNKKLIDTLSGHGFFRNNKKPFFLYAHFKMPHFPYFYSASGDAYPEDSLFNDSLITDRNKFAGYIAYTNQQIKKVVENVLLQSKGNDVIIIQSDHGIIDIEPIRKDDAFRNFNAFYFPDKDYNTLFGGMSNVNTFRIILNKYFEQSLPLLKDKCYYIK